MRWDFHAQVALKRDRTTLIYVSSFKDKSQSATTSSSRDSNINIGSVLKINLFPDG